MNGKDQGKLGDREAKKMYSALLDKAENLLAKEKFGSARHHFMQAYQMQASEELQRKIDQCEKNAARMARAEKLLKEGYQREREKKLKEALKLFQQSLESWENKEIRVMVEKLQSKLPKPSLEPAYQAEIRGNYAEAIDRYQEILEFGDNPEARNRLGICLVKQGDYGQAIEVLESSVLKTPEVNYYLGYSLARSGFYSKALKKWAMISESPKEFSKQKQNLIRTTIMDLKQRAKHEAEFAASYQEAVELFSCCPEAVVQEGVQQIRRDYLEKLWNQERFKEILNFLASIEDLKENDRFWPLLMAKVYYRLAEHEMKYLSEAITYWLTVTYNPTYFYLANNLKDTQNSGLNSNRLRLDFEQRLEQLVHKYRTSSEETFPNELLIHWEMERKSVLFLYDLAQQDANLTDMVCTPAFAERFGLAAIILSSLRNLETKWKEEERFLEVGALFSSARQGFLLCQQGKLEDALATLPPKSDKEDEFVEYCRQYILFRIGMEKVKKGEPNLKKYFMQASPLINRFERYEKEIIQFAQGIGSELDKLISMDEILQALIRSASSKPLMEIASYIMSYKANSLYCHHIIDAEDVSRIYKKALELYPDNEFAKHGLEEIRSGYYIDELNKALNKGNVKKAANITITSGDREVEKLFFEFIETMVDQIDESPLNKKEKIFFLREAYYYVDQINYGHPVLDDIASKLKDLGVEITV